MFTVFVCLWYFEIVSLCRSDCPRSHYIDQAGLEVTDLLSPSRALGLKVYANNICSLFILNGLTRLPRLVLSSHCSSGHCALLFLLPLPPGSRSYKPASPDLLTIPPPLSVMHRIFPFSFIYLLTDSGPVPIEFFAPWIWLVVS